METIKLSSDELSELDSIGEGACSTVYRYSADLVIKVFNEKGLELHDEESFSDIVGIRNDTCVFPESIADVDGHFQGYTMRYIEGTELYKVIRNLDLKILIEAIKKVEEDLRTLSSEKILLQDLNQGGIMWSTEGKIKITDTDFFQKNEDITEDKVYSYNLELFSSLIEMEIGIEMGQSNPVVDFLQSNEEYSQLYTKYIISSLNGNNMSVTALLGKAMEILEQEFEEVPSSIAEIESFLKQKNLFIQEEVETPIIEEPSKSIKNHGQVTKDVEEIE